METPRPPLRAGRRYRILVVDDNRDVTDALAELLAISGHDIERHYTGEGVLEKVRSFKPDVLLLDLGLPQRSGLDIARDIRAHPDSKQILLIAVSGYGQPADIERTRQAGIDFHLLKPVASDELLELLDANLGAAAGK